MVCDRSFAADGSFQYPALDASLRSQPGVASGYTGGVLGDVVLVNGAPWPYLEVAAMRYRFRILNASNARRYEFALSPAPPGGAPAFVQVGSDGGLLAAPVPHATVVAAPAERYDVVVDFSHYPVGTTVTLRNKAGSGTAADVMRFHVVRPARDDSAVPAKLAEVERLDRAAATVTRTLTFARTGSGAQATWTVNGQPFDPQHVDATPRLGATEVWRLRTDARHPVHLHLVHFQVLSRSGKASPYDVGWKDTIDLGPGQTADVVMRFDGYRGRYVMHCHNLEHEDMAMMSNFTVV
jgi:spore coat protein A